MKRSIRLGQEPAGDGRRLVIDGRDVPVRLRRDRRARRFILRLDKHGDGVVVTVPTGERAAAAMEFAAAQGAWIARRLAERPTPIPFAAGKRAPLRGEMMVIEQAASRRGLVRVDPGPPAKIIVPGDAAHLARRLKEWMKTQARDDLTAASRRYANAIGVEFRRISVRDTTSRWGSCSSSGSLSYSWRLVMAPREVLDYVCAHEVAHLVEMNHSRRFWALVERHCPHAGPARRWLKAHGAKLHRYG